MPIDIVVLYDTPEDPEAFDRHFRDVHLPIVRTIPGLLEFETSRGTVGVEGGAPCHQMARLRFASHEALQAALDSDAGHAARADLANFAQAGVALITVDVEPVGVPR